MAGPQLNNLKANRHSGHLPASRPRPAGAPAELHEQSQIVTHGAVQGDLTVDDGKDVDLFVPDGLSRRLDAVERSGMRAGHGGGGQDGAAIGRGLLVLEAQVRKCIAEPLAGRQEARRAMLLTFGILRVVVGLPVDEPGCNNLAGQFLVPLSMTRNDRRPQLSDRS